MKTMIIILTIINLFSQTAISANRLNNINNIDFNNLVKIPINEVIWIDYDEQTNYYTLAANVIYNNGCYRSADDKVTIDESKNKVTILHLAYHENLFCTMALVSQEIYFNFKLKNSTNFEIIDGTNNSIVYKSY